MNDVIRPEDLALIQRARAAAELAAKALEVVQLRAFIRYRLTEADSYDMETGQITRSVPDLAERVERLEAERTEALAVLGEDGAALGMVQAILRRSYLLHAAQRELEQRETEARDHVPTVSTGG